jgi:Ca2+-binding EF-hand superfamily protein
MSKRKILLVAGVLVAAGTVAALAAAPHFRGHHRMGMGFDGGDGPRGARLAERLKEMDANKDGVVTLEEFLGRREGGFARLDRTGDGFVDASDIAARAKENTDYRARRFLKMFDANKDGKVSKDEFEQRARDRFAMRDLNSDGAIDLDDMGPGMRDGMRDRAGRRAELPQDGKEGAEAKEPRRFTLDRLLGRTDRRFARLDKNSDGSVDAADFEAAATERVDFATKRFLKRFDTNNDGKVSKDEFERFAKERFAMLDLDDDGRITESDLPPRMRGMGILK